MGIETEATDGILGAQKTTTTTIIITDAAAKTEMTEIGAATEAIIEAVKTTKLSTAKRAVETRFRRQKVANVVESVTTTSVETLRAETTLKSSSLRCRSARLSKLKSSAPSTTILKPTTSPWRAARRSRTSKSNRFL